MGKLGFRFEPSVWLGAIRALVMLAVALGLNLTNEQIAAILLTSEAITTLIQRSVVSPSATTVESVTVTTETTSPVEPKP